MARISPDGPELIDQGPVEVRTAELGGYTVDFLTVKQDIDMTLMLRGLPGDRCPCPHWGVVTRGSMSVRYGDHDETARQHGLEMAERRSAKDTKDSPRARPTRRSRLKAKRKRVAA